MRILIVSLMLLMPLPALAGQCDRWTAGMEEDEGGSVMAARTCAPKGDLEIELVAQCSGPDHLMVRYLPMTPPGKMDEQPEYKTTLEFKVGEQSFQHEAHFEGMDGALVIDFAIASPMLAAMQTGASISVIDKSGLVPPAAFPLKGSRSAFEKLTKTCAKP